MTVEVSLDLTTRIYKASHLTGHFSLRLGGTSDEFFDNFRFLADPVLLHDIAKAMIPLLPTDTEVLAGPELAGVPLTTVLSQMTGIPSVWVRKEAKTYGTCRLAEGADISGRKVVMMEPMIKTGQFALNICTQLRDLGANVHYALCVIDWERGAPNLLETHGIEQRSLFLYKQVAEAGQVVLRSNGNDG